MMMMMMMMTMMMMMMMLCYPNIAPTYPFQLYLTSPGKHPLKIDTITFAASQFLETVKDQVGVKEFDALVARQGGKTLAFAVDTTGSMTDDIKAARAIAKAIIQEQRTQKVDFILSPFGDPSK